MKKREFVFLVKAVSVTLVVSCLMAGCQKTDKDENKSGKGTIAIESHEGIEEIGEIGEIIEGMVYGQELITVSDKEVTTIDFHLETIEDHGVMFEYAKVTGYAEDREEVWIHQGPCFEKKDIPSCSAAIDSQCGYIFTEGSSVVCLERSTGEILWKNHELNSYGVTSCLDYNENCWICGYEGDELFVVDKNGTTITKIEKIVESDDFYWPQIIEIRDNEVIIDYHSVSRTKPGYGEIAVNMDDFDYRFLKY
jgi:hypothetical protein